MSSKDPINGLFWVRGNKEDGDLEFEYSFRRKSGEYAKIFDDIYDDIYQRSRVLDMVYFTVKGLWFGNYFIWIDRGDDRFLYRSADPIFREGSWLE